MLCLWYNADNDLIDKTDSRKKAKEYLELTLPVWLEQSKGRENMGSFTFAVNVVVFRRRAFAQNVEFCFIGYILYFSYTLRLKLLIYAISTFYAFFCFF